MNRALVLVALACISPGCSATDEPNAVSDAKPAKKAAKPTVEARKTRRMKEGHVLFSAERADLKTEVLPMIASQTGITIAWTGDPRQVTVRFLEPVHWTAAVDLVCRFTNTHLTKDYRGQLVLKDGWGGDLASNPELVEEITKTSGGKMGVSSGGGKIGPSPATSASRSSNAGNASSGSTGKGGAESWSTSYGSGKSGSAYSGGDTAKDLLKGTTTRHSGKP